MKQCKLFVTAYLPPKLEQAWLQHIRDFDTAHKGCHFEIAIDAPNTTLTEAIKELQVNPALTFTQIFERRIPVRSDDDDWE